MTLEAVETSAPPLKPCRYCGLTDCTDRELHADWDRNHEVTIWRKAMAVLTPDDPALPGGTP